MKSTTMTGTPPPASGDYKFVGLTVYQGAIFALMANGDLFRLHFHDGVRFGATTEVEFIQNIMPNIPEGSDAN